MKLRFFQGVFVVVVALRLAVACSGQANAQTASQVLLTVNGEVAQTVKLTAVDIAKLPHRTISAKDHNGKDTTFEGVEIGEILKLAGVKSGEALRGKELALFLVAEASDGYRAVFALPELDHAFTDRIVIVADKRDGKPLTEKEGPLRLVVPDEKREARWVRQVVSLTIKRAPL